MSDLPPDAVQVDPDPNTPDPPQDDPPAAELDPEPQSLTGDGQQRVTVLAHTGCAGLSAGQRATIPRTSEVEFLLADGRLIDVG